MEVPWSPLEPFQWSKGPLFTCRKDGSIQPLQYPWKEEQYHHLHTIDRVLRLKVGAERYPEFVTEIGLELQFSQMTAYSKTQYFTSLWNTVTDPKEHWIPFPPFPVSSTILSISFMFSFLKENVDLWAVWPQKFPVKYCLTLRTF